MKLVPTPSTTSVPPKKLTLMQCEPGQVYQVNYHQNRSSNVAVSDLRICIFKYGAAKSGAGVSVAKQMIRLSNGRGTNEAKPSHDTQAVYYPRPDIVLTIMGELS